MESDNFNVMETKSKIAELSEAILAAHPTMPMLLKQIHTNLKSDPEIVTLLDEEEIQIIVSGLKKQTQTELIQSALKPKRGKKDVIDVDDL